MLREYTRYSNNRGDITKIQKLLLRQSEIREKLNELLGKETRTAGEDTELRALTAEGTAIEPEIRAAMVADQAAESTMRPARPATCRMQKQGSGNGSPGTQGSASSSRGPSTGKGWKAARPKWPRRMAVRAWSRWRCSTWNGRRPAPLLRE